MLSKADPDDLEDLDLLVLPELAFSGTSLRNGTPWLAENSTPLFASNVYISRADFWQVMTSSPSEK